jgi:alcohol dehydrogenase YqhD (iron-dependent ADH family)
LNTRTTLLRTATTQQLKALKELYQPSKTLLVTGNQSFDASGAKALIDECFDADETIHFNDFEVNPQFKDALKGAQLAINSNIDCIVAVGGGSALDNKGFFITRLLRGAIYRNTATAIFKASCKRSTRARCSRRRENCSRRRSYPPLLHTVNRHTHHCGLR